MESSFANSGNNLSADGQLEQPSDVNNSNTATGAYEPLIETDFISSGFASGLLLKIKPKPKIPAEAIAIDINFISAS